MLFALYRAQHLGLEVMIMFDVNNINIVLYVAFMPVVFLIVIVIIDWLTDAIRRHLASRDSRGIKHAGYRKRSHVTAHFQVRSN